MTHPLPSSPTPPDAPTPPDEYAVLRSIVDWSPKHQTPNRLYLATEDVAALASLLRAYEGMRADAERWRYLEDWASGRDVHLCWSQDHDGKRVENRGDHDVLWINAPIGDCDESGYVEGQTLGEAMDEARNQPHV